MTAHDPLEQYHAAIARFDAANRADPNLEDEDGQAVPKELLYARRMTRRLEQFAPHAPVAVRLAARCQHICRWQIPREDYPRGRAGYLQWRKDLSEFHAVTAGRILSEVGYGEQVVERVQSLLRKRRLKTDPDCQLLEDTICLVFFEHYLAEFAQQHDEAKVAHILRRTWRKMSREGRQAAHAINLSSRIRALIEVAVRGELNEEDGS